MRSRGATCQRAPPSRIRPPHLQQAHTRRCSLSLGRMTQYSSLLCARRTALVAVCVGTKYWVAPAGGSSPWRAAVVRRFSCRLQREAGCRVCSKRTDAGARSRCGGGAVLKLAAHAPRRTGCGLLRPSDLGPHRREDSLHRPAAVVRHVSYRLQRQAGCRVRSKSSRCFSVSMGRRRSTQACCCARASISWSWLA